MSILPPILQRWRSQWGIALTDSDIVSVHGRALRSSRPRNVWRTSLRTYAVQYSILFFNVPIISYIFQGLIGLTKTDNLVQRIFTILLRRGRLPIPTLAQHTRLTPKQLRHGLVVLVQQNLIYHYTETITGVTHYEANHHAAYALVRSGKIMKFVEERQGVLARELVHNLLLLGHTKISDLLQAYEAQKAEQSRLAQLARDEALRQQEEDEAAGDQENGDLHTSRTSRANGHVSDPVIAKAGQLHTALARLFDAGLVERVIDSMFRSPTDVQDELEKDIARESSGGGVKTAKQKVEFANRLKRKFRDLRREGTEWRPNARKKLSNGHHVNGINGSHKRRRLSSGAMSGELDYDDDGFYLDVCSNIIIRDECFMLTH